MPARPAVTRIRPPCGTAVTGRLRPATVTRRRTISKRGSTGRVPDLTPADRDELAELVRLSMVGPGGAVVGSRIRLLRRSAPGHAAPPRRPPDRHADARNSPATGDSRRRRWLTWARDPVATAIMYAPGRPIDASVVRKSAKTHGMQTTYQRSDVAGQRVPVVEDTSTTGASPSTAVRAAGGRWREVVGVATVVDRATGAAEVNGAEGALSERAATRRPRARRWLRRDPHRTHSTDRTGTWTRWSISSASALASPHSPSPSPPSVPGWMSCSPTMRGVRTPVAGHDLAEDATAFSEVSDDLAAPGTAGPKPWIHRPGEPDWPELRPGVLFSGAALRDWAGNCLASPYGLVSTAVAGPDATPIPVADVPEGAPSTRRLAAGTSAGIRSRRPRRHRPA